MAADPVFRLSEAQKDCLRLVQAGYEGKEIARILGISPSAVIERLRAARRTLGVATSRQAARLLERHEEADPYNRLVDKPIELSPPASAATFNPSIGNEGSAGEAAAGVWVREDQAPYAGGATYPPTRVPWPVPVTGRKRNDLTALQTIGLVLALTLALGMAALVAIAIVDQLSKLRLG